MVLPAALPTVASSASFANIAGSAFMNSLPGIGSALSSLGSLGSSLGIGGGSKRPRYKPAVDAQLWLEKRSFDQRMQMADQYGIHKLAMLGAPSYSGSVSSVGDTGPTTSERIASAGQDISRAGRELMTHQQRRADTLDALALERAGLENDLLRSQIMRVKQQSSPAMPNPNAQGLSAVIGDIPANQLGVDDSVQPLFKVGYDQKGNPVRVFNEALGDNDAAQIATLPVTAMDLVHGNFTRPLARRLANAVRSLSRNRNSSTLKTRW